MNMYYISLKSTQPIREGKTELAVWYGAINGRNQLRTYRVTGVLAIL